LLDDISVLILAPTSLIWQWQEELENNLQNRTGKQGGARCAREEIVKMKARYESSVRSC
jgi:hypothetical protein